MHLPRQKSVSMSKLGYSTLRDQKQQKKARITFNSISKLKDFRTTYEKPFLLPTLHHQSQPSSEQPQQQVNVKHLFDADFDLKCKKICEELCFHLSVFEKLYRDNYRKKSLLIKFYGWDKQFEQIFFYKKGQELRTDLSPQGIYQKLSLSSKNFTTRNKFNKLRLFLNEVKNNNKRQQQLQSKFMKKRIQQQLHKVDNELVDIIVKKQRNYLRNYVDEIGNMQQMMLQCKVRPHNKMEDVDRIQREFGKIKINQFYGKEENSINQVEKYFTRIRLDKKY